MRVSYLASVLAVSVLSVAGAFGQGLSLSVSMDGGPAPWSVSPSGTPVTTGDGYNYVGSWNSSYCTADWNITAAQDPFVSANITFLNSTALTQIYTVTLTQPIAPPILPASLMGGSVGGSVTDSNFDGLGGASTLAPTPLYLAFLDATPVLPIYSHPSSFANPFPFPGATVGIPTVNLGLPGPTIPAGPVSASISIQHRFQLSAGDSIALTSFFVVTPEPASLLLVAFGGLILIRRR